MSATAKAPALPLIRHLSRLATPVLARLPVSANQITAASLAAGLFACWCLVRGGYGWGIAAGASLVAAYVLDNCDGEIARMKDQCSTFGMWFDTTVDWVVHTAFFIALGIGAAAAFGDGLWLWLGLIAAAGGSINFFLGLFLDARDKARADARDRARADPRDRARADARDKAARPAGQGPAAPRDPEGLRDWAVYAFRELTRADFCFIVLGLAVLDLTWVLLPLGAVGAQVYWITQLVRGARDFHV